MVETEVNLFEIGLISANLLGKLTHATRNDCATLKVETHPVHLNHELSFITTRFQTHLEVAGHILIPKAGSMVCMHARRIFQSLPP